MNWLLRVFSQGKVRSSQPIVDEKRQDMTNVLHIVIEETVMAGAQGLIGFIKRRLDDRAEASEQIVEPTDGESLTTVEELTSKVNVLIEQLHEWSSSTLVSGQSLNSPLNSVEQSVTQEGQKVDSVDRSVISQDMSLKIDSLTQQLTQETQRVNALEARINHLEKLLAKYSAIPKYVEQHHRAIASLQTQMSDLEAPHQTNNHQPVLQLSNADN